MTNIIKYEVYKWFYCNYCDTYVKSPHDMLNCGNFKIFAHNYNIMRIMAGMGGLAYDGGQIRLTKLITNPYKVIYDMIILEIKYLV